MNKPNILLFLVDDLGWRDLSCYGSEFYETPNIDQFSKNGVLFKQAYATSPVCSPSRASIFTGKYPTKVGVTDWIGAHTCGKLIDAPYIDHIPFDNKTIADYLKNQGYATWHVGKWHLGKEDHYPEKHGFDVNIGGCDVGSPPNGYFSPYMIENLKDGLNGEYLTDRITDEAIKLIENHFEHNNNPFFLNLCHYAVHIPIQVDKEYSSKFIQKSKKIELDKIEPFEIGDKFPCYHKKDDYIARRKIQSDPYYAGMLQNLDNSFFRILECLKKLSLFENTIIIFTSDNGGLSTAESSPTCNYPLSEGKGWMYDGGIRIPLIISYPEMIKNSFESNEIVSHIDLLPTILDLINSSDNNESDGVSWKNHLLSNIKLEERPIFWHYPHYGNQGGTPCSCIRLGNYKLIEFFENNRIELYNIDYDIGETNNLSDKLKDKSEMLYRLLKDWQQNTKAKFPEINPNTEVF